VYTAVYTAVFTACVYTPVYTGRGRVRAVYGPCPRPCTGRIHVHRARARRYGGIYVNTTVYTAVFTAVGPRTPYTCTFDTDNAILYNEQEPIVTGNRNSMEISYSYIPDGPYTTSIQPSHPTIESAVLEILRFQKKTRYAS